MDKKNDLKCIKFKLWVNLNKICLTLKLFQALTCWVDSITLEKYGPNNVFISDNVITLSKQMDSRKLQPDCD